MRFFSSRLFFLVLIGVAIFVVTGLVRAAYQHYELRQEIDSLEADVQSLSRKKLESMELLSYVMSPAFAEERARVELNMKNPEESVAVIHGGDEVRRPDAADASSAGQPPGNPIKWWYYFF